MAQAEGHFTRGMWTDGYWAGGLFPQAMGAYGAILRSNTTTADTIATVTAPASPTSSVAKALPPGLWEGGDAHSQTSIDDIEGRQTRST